MRCKVKVTVVDATDFSFVLTRRGWGMLHNVLRALSWAMEAIGLSARLCLCIEIVKIIFNYFPVCDPWIRNSVTLCVPWIRKGRK